MILPVIAWRNIWRNPTRSLVLVGAMVIGMWSLIFIMGFMQGTVESYVRNAIENRTSHVQMHDPAFKDEYEIRYVLPAPDALSEKLEGHPLIRDYSFRTVISGMLSTSRGSYGVVMQGVDPEREKGTTHLDQKGKQGEYLDTSKLNPIFLSEELAERLRVGVQSKVVFQFQQMNSEITAAAFRVSGIYTTGNAQVDAGTAYVLRQDLNRLAGIPEGGAHELAVLLNDTRYIDTVKHVWQGEFPELLVEDYTEISPDLDLMQSQIQISLWIMTAIFMLALIFGIINTMLMAVLERVRELGMLMAIGMNRWRVFLMIMLETIGLALIAAPVGLFLGWRTIAWLGRTGVDLSIYSQGLKQFGMETMVYPVMDTQFYFQILGAVCLTAVLGAIYPAWKAVHLRPVEALRKL